MGRGGALRIFPPWEVRAFGYEIPNPFPSVLLPGITFGLLYLWPFLEQRVTGDHDITFWTGPETGGRGLLWGRRPSPFTLCCS